MYLHPVCGACMKYLLQQERDEENGKDSNTVLEVGGGGRVEQGGHDHGGDQEDVDTAGHCPPHHTLRPQIPDQCFSFKNNTNLNGGINIH